MKILYIQPYCPTKLLVGGELRNRRFVRYLSGKGTVDIFVLMQVGKEADLDYLNTTFRQHHFAVKIGTLTALEKLWLLLPWQLAQFYSKEAQEQLNALVEKEHYDLIFANKLYPVPYLIQLPKQWRSKIVVDFDDVLSDLFRSSGRGFNSLKVSFLLKINEERALKYFKRVFVCASDALARIHPRFHVKVGVAPNVFSVDTTDFFALPSEKTRILFVGSLDYSPNTEGLVWFLEKIWPTVKQQFPQVKLTIVGKTPKPEQAILQFAHYDGVEIYPNAPDVKPFYRDAFVSLVPLLNGSGTRLKILESYAYGRPVITTAKGMEGLDFQNRKNIFLFHDTETFAAAYKALSQDECYRSTRESGFRVLEKKYSPAAFEQKMDEYWRLITGGHNDRN